MFEQITIIGTGLIGGSLGMAVKSRRLAAHVVGCDREDVLETAEGLGAVDSRCSDPIGASLGSELVVLATPVGGIIESLEKLGPVLPKDTLLTDVGSTKAAVVSKAHAVFGADSPKRFLPGHPMAGKENSGIEQADGDLFLDAVWIFCAEDGTSVNANADKFVRLVEAIGARPLFIDSARHDRICAWVSHMQQFVSTAMASVLRDFEDEFRAEFGDTPEIHAIGGRAVREMTRIASSPYSMWRDIAFTNTANIEDSLHKMEQKLAHIRENLRSPELRAEFQRANGFAVKKT